MVLAFAISQDDREGGMHFAKLLNMVLAFETVDEGIAVVMVLLL